eukprot:c6682_g1_i2.p1 GENE.c6682_g1_i2~~c6682_g1_i2.p1  ORF type:complete len:494 (+),score=90.27 c6682_g1_i2:226-1707(+)
MSSFLGPSSCSHCGGKKLTTQLLMCGEKSCGKLFCAVCLMSHFEYPTNNLDQTSFCCPDCLGVSCKQAKCNKTKGKNTAQTHRTSISRPLSMIRKNQNDLHQKGTKRLARHGGTIPVNLLCTNPTNLQTLTKAETRNTSAETATSPRAVPVSSPPLASSHSLVPQPASDHQQRSATSINAHILVRKKLAFATSPKSVFRPLLFECTISNSNRIRRLARRGGLTPTGTIGPEPCSPLKPHNWFVVRRNAPPSQQHTRRKRYHQIEKPQIGARVLTRCADMVWHLGQIVELTYSGSQRLNRPPKYRIDFVEGQDMHVEIPNRDVLVLPDCSCCCLSVRSDDAGDDDHAAADCGQMIQDSPRLATDTEAQTANSPPLPAIAQDVLFVSSEDRQAFATLGIRAWSDALSFAKHVCAASTTNHNLLTNAVPDDSPTISSCKNIWRFFLQSSEKAHSCERIAQSILEPNLHRVRALLQAMLHEQLVTYDLARNLWSRGL